MATKSDNHQCSCACSCPSPTSKKQNLDLVGAMSLSETDSLASSLSSSSDDATQRHAASRRLISNRGGTLQKSSDDIDFLAAKFAATKLSPSRTFLCSSDGLQKGLQSQTSSASVFSLSFQRLKPRLTFCSCAGATNDKGIPSVTTHTLLFHQAAELSNVVALDDAKPHTLLFGMSFFGVNNSIVDGENL